MSAFATPDIGVPLDASPDAIAYPILSPSAGPAAAARGTTRSAARRSVRMGGDLTRPTKKVNGRAGGRGTPPAGSHAREHEPGAGGQLGGAGEQRLRLVVERGGLAVAGVLRQLRDPREQVRHAQEVLVREEEVAPEPRALAGEHEA